MLRLVVQFVFWILVFIAVIVLLVMWPPDIKVEHCECLTIIAIDTHHTTDLSLVLDGRQVDSKSGVLHLFSVPVGYNIQIYDGQNIIWEGK